MVDYRESFLEKIVAVNWGGNDFFWLYYYIATGNDTYPPNMTMTITYPDPKSGASTIFPISTNIAPITVFGTINPKQQTMPLHTGHKLTSKDLSQAAFGFGWQYDGLFAFSSVQQGLWFFQMPKEKKDFTIKVHTYWGSALTTGQFTIGTAKRDLLLDQTVFTGGTGTPSDQFYSIGFSLPFIDKRNFGAYASGSTHDDTESAAGKTLLLSP